MPVSLTEKYLSHSLQLFLTLFNVTLLTISCNSYVSWSIPSCSIRCCLLNRLLFSSHLADKEGRHNLLLEAAAFKIVNRQNYLEASQDEAVQRDDVIVSLLADLQQEQDQESEKLVNDMQDKVTVFLLAHWVSCGG